MESLRIQLQNEKSNQELKNICLYVIGKTISIFGSSIYSFALGLYVLQITGSALNFAITLILGTIPMIVMNPFAGVIADKVDKKKLVVCMDLLSGSLIHNCYLYSKQQLWIKLIHYLCYYLSYVGIYNILWSRVRSRKTKYRV
ncbi:MFS transporter [Bacillus cereus]|uniref:Major facilitator superfamily (MFS) profile domain-containing protein n=1 Tax=Bacillus cereus VD118 TaxID=1053231 RepID=R8QDM0_BACCE|nr:MFS transporter [Bacillus cereus]EOP69226.1 hypothetical protein IIQ_01528 [Bacillus cereus VD118]